MRVMTRNTEIYCDANASYPMLEAVRARLAQILSQEPELLGNPSSVHRSGQRAKRAVFELKSALCEVLGARDVDDFVLTSGATEALNLALRGFVRERLLAGRKPVLLSTTIEHAAVLDTFHDLETLAPVHLLKVDARGRFSHEEFFALTEQLLADPTVDVLCTLQLANNECGSVYDFSFLPEAWRRFGPKVITELPKQKGGKHPQTPQRLWFCLDAAQALGKMPEDFIRRALHYADYCVLSSHKIGGPTGIGALWLRAKSPLAPLLTGGSQEKKRRAGTHNILGILGFHAALRDWQKNGADYRDRMRNMRSKVLSALREIEGLHLHAQVDTEIDSLCNTLNFHVEACEDDSLLIALDLDHVCTSSGSACHSGSIKASPVLLAMGFNEAVARSSLRLSLHAGLSDEDLARLCQILPAKVKQIRDARELADRILPKFELGSEAG
jgi:cysteine desulfurase